MVSAKDGKSLNKGWNNGNGGEEAESTELGDPSEVKDDPQVFAEQKQGVQFWTY